MYNGTYSADRYSPLKQITRENVGSLEEVGKFELPETTSPTGNPGPDFAGHYRTGDNLCTSSVVSLDAATGALRGHHQFVKHDVHDWDIGASPALFTSRAGHKRVAVIEGNIFGRFIDGLAGQNRIHALDGADANLRMGIDVAAGQALHVVQLRELTAVIRWRIRHELLVRLLAQVARINQKQDALRATELEQTIYGRDGCKCFARTRGHVNQCARTILGQRFFHAGDGRDLALAQVACGQRWHRFLEAATQSVRLGKTFAQMLRSEEVENLT
jgi:hypothetical protein